MAPSIATGIPSLIFRRKPYVTLKPAQKKLERDYYRHNTRNVPDSEGYFTNYKRFGSVYNDKHNQNVKPKDYLEANIASNNLSNGTINFSWI